VKNFNRKVKEKDKEHSYMARSGEMAEGDRERRGRTVELAREGFMEGSPKLQCEKLVCEEARLKHLAKMEEEVAAFIARTRREKYERRKCTA
jgi:hypothetical protein